MGDIVGRGKIKMASAYHFMSQQGCLTLVHIEKLKPMIKGTISGRMLSSGISHVAFASVYSEKTRLKKCPIMIIIIIIIMNKSQESTVFHGCQKLTSAMKQRPEK